MFFGGAWIFGGWGAVGWGCKSYLGPAEIVSFSSRTFSNLNQLWFKCETLLFFLIIFYYISSISSRPQMFLKVGVLKNFANFTGKHLWGPQACNFIKKRLQHRCFPVKLAKFLRTPFLKNTSGGCFCTYCTHMTSHAIWVHEITDIMVSIKKINKS